MRGIKQYLSCLPGIRLPGPIVRRHFKPFSKKGLKYFASTKKGYAMVGETKHMIF